jgi:hypothetical protein
MLKGHIITFIEHYMEGKIRENIENCTQILYMYNYQSPTHIILLLICMTLRHQFVLEGNFILQQMFLPFTCTEKCVNRREPPPSLLHSISPLHPSLHLKI